MVSFKIATSVLLGLSTIMGTKAAEALRGVSEASVSDTVVVDSPRELTMNQTMTMQTTTSSSSYGTTCVRRKYDNLKSCLDEDTRCFVFYLYFNKDFVCDDLGDFNKYMCPCESLCDEYEDEIEFKYDYCGEFAYGCRRACRKYLTDCCDYPSGCSY